MQSTLGLSLVDFTLLISFSTTSAVVSCTHWSTGDTVGDTDW